MLDALDECNVNRRLELLDIFIKLTHGSETTVKTLVSSRNDLDIEAHFSQTPNLSITATDNGGDISRFVNQAINSRLLIGRASKQLKERMEIELNEKASGVFRWVALQIHALCDLEKVYSEEDVDYLLTRLPRTLEEAYLSNLTKIERLPPPSREAVKNVIRLLIRAEYPMDTDEISQGLAVLSDSPKIPLESGCYSQNGARFDHGGYWGRVFHIRLPVCQRILRKANGAKRRARSRCCG